MTVPDWQQRRNELNHDWLKNEYLPALWKWSRLLNQEVDDPEFEARFRSEVLPSWEKGYRRVKELIETFEQEMTPAVYLERMPLARCDAASRSWLGGLVHQLWLERHSVQVLVETARKRAGEANDAYAAMTDALRVVMMPLRATAAASTRAQFGRFRSACSALGDAIEQFPHRILVT